VLNRREFLVRGGLTAAALYAAPLAVCGAEDLLPQVIRRGAPKKIAILGAGLAGLVAAYELQRAGHEVHIFEAQMHPGGRVRTLREPFSDGLYAEAGAGRIPTSHFITRKYVTEFGLKLEPFWPTRLADVYYLKGQRIKVPRGTELAPAKTPFDLTPAERVQPSFEAIQRKYIGKAVQEAGSVPANEWPPERLKKYNDTTIAEYFQQQGASSDASRFLLQGFEDDSALDFFRDAWSHSFGLDKITGGNDRLPRAFAAKLGPQIHYGAQIVAISADTNSATITLKQTSTTETFLADHVICTLPFTVLRGIELPASLSAAKREVIEKMRYGAVTRVYLQSRMRYWEGDGLNGYATPDLPMEIWSPTLTQPGTRGIVMSYIYEEMARKVAAMAPEARIEDFLELAEKIFPGMKQNFEGGTSYSWDQDPFQRGAYALYKKGEMLKFEPEARRAEGRLHFAGEHTSPWSGWMQGALYSGLRAANEVCEAS